MNFKTIVSMFISVAVLMACNNNKNETTAAPAENEEFQYSVDRFADLEVLRYQVPGWDNLTLKEKELVYYLSEAGYSGRDIIWDQNYKHNLAIRKALEHIYQNYNGDKNTEDWKNFVVYLKRIWFSNGIHHHYSNDKIKPDFSRSYFDSLLEETGTKLDIAIADILFNDIDNKKVNLDISKGLVSGSAVNFYGESISDKEAETFYGGMKSPDPKHPVSIGLNTKLVKENGKLVEKVWKSGGMYGPAIDKIIYWLEKAKGVAENQKQADALGLLIEYYKTGGLLKNLG